MHHGTQLFLLLALFIRRSHLFKAADDHIVFAHIFAKVIFKKRLLALFKAIIPQLCHLGHALFIDHTKNHVAPHLK